MGLGFAMKMNFNLNLAQTQKLIMTPELKQAIEILQYNSLELNEFIQDELLSNPVLQQTSAGAEAVEKEPEPEKPASNDDDVYDKIDWKAVAGEFEDGRVRQTNYEKKDDVNYDNFVAAEESLVDHLCFQLQMTNFSEIEIKAAMYVVENIDENGYLEIDYEDISRAIGIDNDTAETIIQTIQTFDPPGVAARSLEECLLIQLTHFDDDVSVECRVVASYLDDLASNRIQKIAKALDISLEIAQIACDRIRKLEPKPGREYASLREVRYVTPDVYIDKVEGKYVIRVSESSAPKLYINAYYRSILRQEAADESAVGYINKKLTSALKLIKSIEQRRNTIYRVVDSIINFQYDFFEKGAMYLKPLNLKDVADEIGVHESTVSRAVNGKYLQCGQGLFEIKHFFQSGVTGAFGEGVSAESIKMLIKDLVGSEDPKKPLSDQKISNELGKAGIKVSRRTIAKYRDELSIPSTSKRKRF